MSPSAARSGPSAGAFARITVSTVMAVIAALAFVFSFGNVWALALRLGVPAPVAPLIAPMVDLSVVGLLVALHHLAVSGAHADHLRGARRLMHLCGLLTLALNTAEPLLAGHYGRAALDTVAPALLLGWGSVGPVLLFHLHAAASAAASTDETEPVATTAVVNKPEESELPAIAPEPPEAPRRPGRPPAASMEELLAVARPAVVSGGLKTTVVKQALADAAIPVASARLTELMKRLRADPPAPSGP